MVLITLSNQEYCLPFYFVEQIGSLMALTSFSSLNHKLLSKYYKFKHSETIVFSKANIY